MANIEIRSVEGLAGSGVPYAYAVKAGPWLFLTGHEAFDFATGPAPEVEGPAGFPSFGAPRLKREAEYILKRMRKTLAEFGADFKSSVRVDQYYPVFEAVRAYQLARHGEFGDYIPPSTSVLMERLFKANSHICMSMIAVVPGKDYEIGKLYPKEVPVPIGSFFVPAITCNDFVFVAGQMATDENALDPSVKLPKEVRNWGGPNAVRRQTEFVIKKRLEPALKAGGSSWQNVLKAQIYVPTAADIPDALDVWQQHVPHACALTAVPTHGFGFIDGVVEINLLALRDGAKRKKEVLKVDLPAMSDLRRLRARRRAGLPVRAHAGGFSFIGSFRWPFACRAGASPCHALERRKNLPRRRHHAGATSCARSGSWPTSSNSPASSWPG